MIIRSTLSEIPLSNVTWTQSSSLSLQLRAKAWWWFNNRHIIVAVSFLRSGRDKHQILGIGKGKLPDCMVHPTIVRARLATGDGGIYAYVLVDFLDAD